MVDAYLAGHAASAYNVDSALLMRALSLASPFPLPEEFLRNSGWTRPDHDTPEHNAYLTARWIAALQAAGHTPNAVLDTMTAAVSVPWRAPWYYRVWKLWRTLIRR